MRRRRGADERQALEQVCCCITRPALANEGMQCNSAGQVVLKAEDTLARRHDAPADVTAGLHAAAGERWEGERIAGAQFFYDPVQRQPRAMKPHTLQGRAEPSSPRPRQRCGVRNHGTAAANPNSF